MGTTVPSVRKLFATTMIGGAGALAAALTLSPAAMAEPVPPAPAPAPAPGLENIPFVNQIAGLPAVAPQLLQGVASAFTNGGQSTNPVDPIAPAPTATASVALPGAAPAAAALPAATTGAVPGAQAGMAGLTQQLGLPVDLASLMPAGTALSGLLPAAAPAAAGAPAAAAPANAASSLMPMLLPVSALP